jgi:hypothetical protein
MQAKDARDQYADHVSLKINILDAIGLVLPRLEEEKKEEAQEEAKVDGIGQ